MRLIEACQWLQPAFLLYQLLTSDVCVLPTPLDVTCPPLLSQKVNTTSVARGAFVNVTCSCDSQNSGSTNSCSQTWTTSVCNDWGMWQPPISDCPGKHLSHHNSSLSLNMIQLRFKVITLSYM